MWKNWTHKSKYVLERRIQKEKRQWRGIRTRRCPPIIPTARRQRPRHVPARQRVATARRRGRHDTNYENMGSFNAEIVKKIRNSQVEVNVSENGKVEWILDSGCTDHIINNELYFTNYVCLKKPINVKVGDGRSMQATKVGNIQTYFLTYGKRVNIKISNVFYEREMDRNLLSYAKVTDKNKIVSKDNTSKIYNEYHQRYIIN